MLILFVGQHCHRTGDCVSLKNPEQLYTHTVTYQDHPMGVQWVPWLDYPTLLRDLQPGTPGQNSPGIDYVNYSISIYQQSQRNAF